MIFSGRLFILIIFDKINFYMNKINHYLSQILAEKALISEEEQKEINNYRQQEIFSLHNALLSFLYLSIC